MATELVAKGGTQTAIVMRTPIEPAPVHYGGLDLMRFVAAMLVVLDHFSLFGWGVASAQVAPSQRAFPEIGGMSAIGSVGVEVFFLISGFVISASALHETAKGFAVRRMIRLLPALWICSGIALAARLSVGEPLITLVMAAGRSMILSPSGPYIDGVVWTLVVEAVFYACFFVCLLRGKANALITFGYALGALSALFVTCLFIADVPMKGVSWAARAVALGDRFPAKVLLLRHGVFFSAGMQIWDLQRRGLGKRRLAFLVMMLAACSLEIVTLRPGAFAVLASLSIWWAALGLLVLCIKRPDLFGIHRLTTRRALVFAGKLSYPIYLCHYSVGLVLVFWLSRIGLARPLVFVVAISAVIMLSAVVAFLIEGPIQSGLRARWSPRRTPAPQTRRAL